MESRRASKIFNKIAEVGSDFVRSILGEVGEKLVVLFDALGNHPEADDLFFEDGDLDLCGLMDIARLAASNEVPLPASRIPAMASVVASERLMSSVVPGRGGCMARLMRKPRRETARATRRIQRLGSSSFMKDVAMRWHCSPATFDSFVKGRLPCRPSPIDSAVVAFDAMGCRGLSGSATQARESFYEPPSAFGYKKISPLTASCIFAKHYGFDLVRDRGAFNIIVRRRSGSFLYSPVVVPLPLAGIMPAAVAARIEEAEHSRDLFMDSVFDHYLVVLPFCGERIGPPAGVPNFPESEDFLSALSEEVIGSVVLGERNGECYFVCEWNRLN